jgi:hypothetical protein
MVSLRRLAWICQELAKQHVDEPDVPAAPDGADGYAEWTQIALILFGVELEKSLRETEDYLNEMPGILAVFDLDEAPHYSSFCRWEDEYRMRELRHLLPFSGRIRERHRRRHRKDGPRYHSSDSLANDGRGGYCIFCVRKLVSDAVTL